MKKFLLTVAAIATMALGASAQNLNMIVTHTDGTVDTIPTSAVSKVSFNIPDVNADQVVAQKTKVQVPFSRTKDLFSTTIAVSRP